MATEHVRSHTRGTDASPCGIDESQTPRRSRRESIRHPTASPERRHDDTTHRRGRACRAGPLRVMNRPSFSPSAPLQIIVNDKAGSSDTDTTRSEIEDGLREAGREGTLLLAAPGELPRIAADAADKAKVIGSAVVAVGGDGTINTVAQAAHSAGCAMGVIPEGTFNYFGREHSVPTERAEAVRWLLAARPEPVQISAINEQAFLVNASVGLYPDLLQDRERWTAMFGRSRLVALGAGLSTLLRSRRHLTLSIEWAQQRREMSILTLFVGNNQLQLVQLGLEASDVSEACDTPPDGENNGTITAVILKSMSTAAKVGLVVRGALGQLGDARNVERFACEKLIVAPTRASRQRKMKVAFDGEVAWMNPPLTIRVLNEPLWLLKAAPDSNDAVAARASGSSAAQ